MFFTQDDYKKILEWLKHHSIKDSELPEALDIQGNEILTLILNGLNVRIYLKDFLDYILLSFGTDDFINLNLAYGLRNVPIYEAIRKVPISFRKLGLIITFTNEEGKWVIYQFQGESIALWNNVSLWIDIIENTILKGTVIPDEEDLTPVFDNDKVVIKFRDKAYNPIAFTGLGRMYLRLNIQTVESQDDCENIEINILTQDMIPYENTIYIIQYDYDLNGLTIVIPENSVLKFEGGSFRNGTIVLINTTIVAFNNNITNCIDTTISGNFAVGLCLFDTELGKPKWWNGTNWADAMGNNIDTNVE